MSCTFSADLASATQPLSDILPWGSPVSAPPGADSPSEENPPRHSAEARTLLVTDACSADGRFLLNALALQFSSSDRVFPGSDVGPATTGGSVLWVGCSPATEGQIASGLRRASQHGLGGVGVGPREGGPTHMRKGGGGAGWIHIVSVPLEIAKFALDRNDDEEEGCDATPFSHEAYLRRVHRRILHWLNRRELPSMGHSRQASRECFEMPGPRLIIIDNFSTLGTLFGDRLAGAFLSGVRSSLRKHAKDNSNFESNKATGNAWNRRPAVTITHLLAVRAMSPDDGGLHRSDRDGGVMIGGEMLQSEPAKLLRPWMCLGSGAPAVEFDDGLGVDLAQMEERAARLSLHPRSAPSILHRTGLYEMADGIVDVSPLGSGYARDVLGRLSFAANWSGRGWWGVFGRARASGGRKGGSGPGQEEIDGAYLSFCVNYRCDDSGVHVMRLRSG